MRTAQVRVEALPIGLQIGGQITLNLFLCGALLAAIAFKIWTQAQSTQVGYELASARKYAIELDMQRRELELHKSFMLRPDRLREAASLRLGLEDLSPKQAIKIQYVD